MMSARVCELRPPCHHCGHPSLTTFCPMTPQFVVLRSDLTSPKAAGRVWVCGSCLITAITNLSDLED